MGFKVSRKTAKCLACWELILTGKHSTPHFVIKRFLRALTHVRAINISWCLG